MSIIKWNRNNDFFPSIIGEIFNDEVYDKIANRMSVPAVNLVESDNCYEIHMAAPGLKKVTTRPIPYFLILTKVLFLSPLIKILYGQERIYVFSG